MGPANDTENAQQLAKHTNVRMLGVVPYDEMVGYLTEIDVAIVPHLRNHLTEKMNPLKVYNYFAAGLPVVSTDIANLGQIGTSLYKANNADEFISQLRVATTTPIDTKKSAWRKSMQKISWADRTSKILEIMDESIGQEYFSKKYETRRKTAVSL